MSAEAPGGGSAIRQVERWQVSLAVALLVAIWLFWLVPHPILTILAGLLVAVAVRGGGDLVGRLTGLSTGWNIGLFLLLAVLVIALFLFVAAATLAAQADQFIERLPQLLERARAALGGFAWIERGLASLQPSDVVSGEAGSGAMSILGGLFGTLGNIAVALLIGIYVALDPGLYRRGIIRLFAPSLRDRVALALDRSAATLKRWLGAQLAAMAIDGALCGLALWLVGVPLALLLGVLTGLLAFIPNIGAIVAIIPALLLAAPEGLATMGWVVVVFVAIQAIDGYVVIPMLQKEAVELPPAFLLAMQLLFGTLFGIKGLLLSTPIAAVMLVLVRMFWTRDYLEDRPPEEPGAQG